jgi:hypothetical protein
MPIKPWTMAPKKSLGIFEGLGNVLDERAGRQAAAAKQQMTLEDALSKRQDRKAAQQSRTIEDALHQAQADALNAKPTTPLHRRQYDEKRGVVVDLDDGTSTSLNLSPIEEKKPDPYGGRTREQWLLDEKAKADATYHAPRDPSQKAPLPAEFEKKADFMLEGAKTAAETLKGYVPHPRSLISKIPFAGNYGLTEEDQVAQQAAETLHDAYLRLTTGATINKDELSRAAKQYIAQPGDGPKVLAAKQKRRDQVITALERAASSVRRPSGPARGSVAPAKAGADPEFEALMARYGKKP